MMTQLEAAKHLLFDKDGLDVADVKLFPGNNRDATPEQMAEQLNKALAQILDGDYDEISDEDD